MSRHPNAKRVPQRPTRLRHRRNPSGRPAIGGTVNIQRKKNSAIASAWLVAFQRDLDGDQIDELLISSKDLAGNSETTYLVFKVSSDRSHFNYIGSFSVMGGRVGVYSDPDGTLSVVTGGQSGSKFYVLYYRNNGKSFSVKSKEEYEIDSERILGLPKRVTDLFPELKHP